MLVNRILLSEMPAKLTNKKLEKHERQEAARL